MSRKSILLIIVISLLTLVEIVAWSRFQSGGWDSTGVVMLHLGAAAATSLFCSPMFSGFRLGTRVTILIFLCILTAILPLAGIPAAGLLTLLLNTPAGDGMGPEDSFVFGNPSALQARRESREPKPCLQPLVEAMRYLDVKDTERMLHGLRHMRPVHKTLPFLRRFQTDPKSSLQFASQAIISSEFELRELQVKELQARLEQQPQSLEVRIQLAEVLLSMADWTPDGDSTALVYFRDALKHLVIADELNPHNSRVQLLQSAAHIGLGQPQTALPLLSSVEMRQGRSALSIELRLKALQAQGDLLSLSQQATEVAEDGYEGDLGEAIAFWAAAPA